MLYTNAVTAGHTEIVPVMAPGVAGIAALTVTAVVCAALTPHELDAVTVILPF